MTLSSYQNIEEHFDSIDASIFNGELLQDDMAITEIEEYIKRWTRAIEAHRKAQHEQVLTKEYGGMTKDS